ncbi:MAG: hypothetical protein M1829_002960 [Trizodia sp. TS-e1964]|nr:MAG: hypothetical protein M1829_002960 [Trizodia sp. TS-e1964]
MDSENRTDGSAAEASQGPNAYHQESESSQSQPVSAGKAGGLAGQNTYNDSGSSNPSTTNPSTGKRKYDQDGVDVTPRQQGADKPADVPTDTQTAAIKQRKETVEASASTGTPADNNDTATHKPDAGPPPVAGTVPDSKPKPQSESTGSGTGEKWVKSTGLAADGGDFDASAPGAGKEADRLLEQKGIKRSTPGESGAAVADKLKEKANKPSMGEKIKDKLHIGGGSHADSPK